MYSCAGVQPPGLLHAVDYIGCATYGHKAGAHYYKTNGNNKALGGDGDVHETSS